MIHSPLQYGVLPLALLVWSAMAFATETANTLTWKVESERGVYGYLVYRAERSTGPYRRIHFAAAGKSAASQDAGRYRYIDGDVIRGETYYYVIYSVGTNGVKQRLSDALRKMAGGKSARMSASKVIEPLP